METEAPESNEVLSSGTLQIQQEVRLVLLINNFLWDSNRFKLYSLYLPGSVWYGIFCVCCRPGGGGENVGVSRW